MTNRIKGDKSEKKKNKKGVVSRTVTALLNGEFLTRDGLIRFMPFILFLTALFVSYIAIGYYFESTLRDHVKAEDQLEELTSEYNTIQSQLENKKQQSAVVKDIDNLGLEAPEHPPTIIEVSPGYFEE